MFKLYPHLMNYPSLNLLKNKLINTFWVFFIFEKLVFPQVAIIPQKKFLIGIQGTFLTHQYWNSTDSLALMSDRSSSSETHYTYNALTPAGINIGYQIIKNLFLQTGLFFSKQYFNQLTDKDFTGLREYYKTKELHIPFSVTFKTDKTSSPFFTIGFKSNCIFYEDLVVQGYIIAYPAPNPYVDTTFELEDKGFKFHSITPTISLGGALRGRKKRVGFAYFATVDFPQVYHVSNTFLNMSFTQFSTTNFQLTFHF